MTPRKVLHQLFRVRFAETPQQPQRLFNNELAVVVLLSGWAYLCGYTYLTAFWDQFNVELSVMGLSAAEITATSFVVLIEYLSVVICVVVVSVALIVVIAILGEKLFGRRRPVMTIRSRLMKIWEPIQWSFLLLLIFAPIASYQIGVGRGSAAFKKITNTPSTLHLLFKVDANDSTAKTSRQDATTPEANHEEQSTNERINIGQASRCDRLIEIEQTKDVVIAAQVISNKVAQIHTLLRSDLLVVSIVPPKTRVTGGQK